MLYDKRWDKPEVKADPFSLESLIAWLEKQPAAQAYCYTDNGRCLLSQYFESLGFSQINMSTTRFHHRDGMEMLPPHFDDVAVNFPRTFGKALRRARAALCS